MKKNVGLVLLALGSLLITLSTENFPKFVIGAVLYIAGHKMSLRSGRNRLLGILFMIAVLVLGWFGGLNAIVAYGFSGNDINFLHIAAAIVAIFFGVMASADDTIYAPIGKDMTDRYRLHCNAFGLKMYSVPFFFMTSVGDDIAIGEDMHIYSYINRSLKKLPIKHIARYEVQQLEGKTINRVVLFENNGNYHWYDFPFGSAIEDGNDVNYFLNVLDYLLNENIPEFDSLDETMSYYENRFDKLCSLGNIPKDLYPDELVNAARMDQ